MPIRNPFRRAGGAEVLDDSQRTTPDLGFQKTAVAGAKPIEIKEPTEYKLSGKGSPSPLVGAYPQALRRLE